MSFKSCRLATIMAESTVGLSAMGAASGIGRMISTGSRPNEFLLYWEPSKLVLPALVGMVLGVVIGAVRARNWLTEYRKMIHSMVSAGGDPSSVFPSVPDRERSPL